MKNLNKILIIILIIAGVIYNITFVFSFDKKYPEEAELTAVARVVSMKTEKERSNSYTVKILSSNLDKARNTKIILYTGKSENLEYGDIVKISGTFSKVDSARNYKGFDYRKYLKQSKIYGSMYCKNVKFLEHQSSLIGKIFELKMKLYAVLDNLYKEDSNAFLKGILLGDSSNLNDEIKDNFKNSSMSHVLAISGMHVAYVILGVQFILDKIINSRKLKNYITIGILGFFVIITGGAASCMRACIMSSMLLLSQNFYRKNNFYVTILFTFLVLLFINPYNIFAVRNVAFFWWNIGNCVISQFFETIY